MKHFKHPQTGQVYAYPQEDLDRVAGIAALELAAQDAQASLDGLTVPPPEPHEGDDPHAVERAAYEKAQAKAAEAHANLARVPRVFFDIREKLAGLVEMTEAELEAHTNPPPDLDREAEAERARRDYLLAASDWVIVRSHEAGETVPQPWIDYRQALRDVPEQDGFPLDINWPESPQAIE